MTTASLTTCSRFAMEVPKPTVEQWVRGLRGATALGAGSDESLTDYDALLCPTTQLLPRSVEDWSEAWLRDAEQYPHGTFAPTVYLWQPTYSTGSGSRRSRYRAALSTVSQWGCRSWGSQGRGQAAARGQ